MPGYNMPASPGAIPSRVAPAYQPISFGQAQFVRQNPGQNVALAALGGLGEEKPSFSQQIAQGLGEGIGAGVKAGINQQFENYNKRKEAERQKEDNRIKLEALKPTMLALGADEATADSIIASGMPTDSALNYLKSVQDSKKAQAEYQYAQNLANYQNQGAGLGGEQQRQVNQQIQQQNQPQQQPQINPQTGQPEIQPQMQNAPVEEERPLIGGLPAPEIPRRFSQIKKNIPAIKPEHQIALSAQQDKNFDNLRKAEAAIVNPQMKDLNESRVGLIERQSSLKDAAKVLSTIDTYLMGDYLANLTGIEALRSQKGTELNTLLKSHLVGTVSKFGARPNQYIEQTIAGMGPLAGRNPLDNEIINERLLKNADVDANYLQNIDELSKYYLENLGFVPQEVFQEAQKRTKIYEEKRNEESAYKIQQMKEKRMTDAEKAALTKQEVQTPLTDERAAVYLKRFPNPEDFLKAVVAMNYKLPPDAQKEYDELKIQGLIK